VRRKEFVSRMGELIFQQQAGFWSERGGERITGSFPIPIATVEQYFERGVSRIWDVGCGNGRKTFDLKRAGFDVFGIDINEEAFAEARACGEQEFGRVLFSRLDIAVDISDDLRKRPPILDGFLFQAVLTNLLSFGVARAAKNAEALLKPGGVVIASDFLRNDQDCSIPFGREREYWATRYRRDAEVTFDEGTIVVFKDSLKDPFAGMEDKAYFLDTWELLASKWGHMIDHYAKHWTLDEIRGMFPGLTLDACQIVPAQTKRHLVTGVIAVWRKT
jgi:SAM-dependent methyltransferase